MMRRVAQNNARPGGSLLSPSDQSPYGRTMKTSLWIKGLTLMLALVSSAARGETPPLTIFAAASLQGPLDEIARSWPGDTTISYAGSGTIARQISLGAPADVVILASPDWMDWLAERGHLYGAAIDLLSNRLVLIGPAGAAPLPAPSAEALRDRLGDGRLAMGQHEAVPAGLYAAAWLRHIGAWDGLRAQLAETENVRAALVLVSRGEAPLGLVYASDAAAEPGVAVLHTVPPDTHPPIRYPAAAITAAGAPFLDHLAAHRDRFVAAGFTALP